MKYLCFRKTIAFIHLLIITLFGSAINAATVDSTDALIIIGSSYANGTTRIDDNQFGSLFGLAVASGGYLSLGDALVRTKKLNGLVINEASVGSTTFDRFSCLTYECLPFGKLLGYETQFNNALNRTAIYDPDLPGVISGYNAKYVVIGIPNDCIHSDSFGIPQIDTQPCSIEQINQSADAIINVAKLAESLGMTVIIPLFPRYEALDLELVKQQLGLLWVVDEYQYNSIRSIFKKKFKAELVNSLIVNLWREFENRGDGIHPNRKTVTRAARRIARIITREEQDIP